LNLKARKGLIIYDTMNAITTLKTW
jgi:hypothetical protein